MKPTKMLLVLLLLPMLALGGVSLKNGNFYITYSDVLLPGDGHDLEISRTYNSRSTDKGWFGYGWGSYLETNLVVSADGSVTINENGSGAKTRFIPKEKINAQAAAERIVEAMRKKVSISEDVAKSLVTKLKNDADLRRDYARRAGVETKLAVGSVLYSNERGIQTLETTEGGYTRIFNDGKQEMFDKEGRLVQVLYKDKYSLNVNYKNGTLESVKDSKAKQLFFSWYPNGFVKEIWTGTDKKKVSYEYKGVDLVKSTDIDSNVFVYEYDINHNMISITYADGTKRQIAYQPKTFFVEKVTERNGQETAYKYDSDPKDPDYHYWTEVSKKSPGGKAVTNRYEYEIKSRPDGSHYTHRILTEVNGVSTETIYSECCNLPTKITRGKDVTNFEYNGEGLLLKKTSTRGEYVELQYHPEFKKITRVVNKEGWTNFAYDKKGNLFKAENQAGKSILLIYDRRGRITKMIDSEKGSKDKRTLAFQYNSLGKPVEINMENVGKINVEYDNYGEIKKVDSKSGQKMALQVTQAFQSLLSIVKPAGVSLNL